MNTDTYDTLAINSGLGAQFTPDGTLFHYFDSLLQAFHLPYRLLGEPWTETVSNKGRFSAWAVYGDAIWHVTDKFNLTTGLRYTRDRKYFDGTRRYATRPGWTRRWPSRRRRHPRPSRPRSPAARSAPTRCAPSSPATRSFPTPWASW
ncbi:hypothetical protein RLIN73S_01586 [Rhodanobacter lindaniclasticus]